ncbi:MAG TPA: hypothetical protein VJ418_23575 [Streptosporangiaceae bacterium]|jgi:hypothetical protein|nr:hypothetical protein [Streptosporangiaceae bacterium]
MTTTLQLTRTWAALTDRGKWQILIDGTTAGSINQKETVELPVEPGHHTLRVRGSGRFGSPEGSFDAADDQEIRFFCPSARYWPLMLAALVKPDLWITLRRE